MGLWGRFKRQIGISPKLDLKPEEKAAVGKGTWGRQEVKARPKGTISARVYRAATDEWEDRGVISGPEEV